MQLLAAAIAHFNVLSEDDGAPLVWKDLGKQGKCVFPHSSAALKMHKTRTFLTVIKI